MRRLHAGFVVFVLALFSAATSAAYTPQEIEAGLARCEKHPPGPQVEVNACAGYQAAKADLSLTDAYSRLREYLKKYGDPGDAEHLLKVQRAWIAYREATCQWESGDTGTMAAYSYSNCMREWANSRTFELTTALKVECEQHCQIATGADSCTFCST
jgi:uncharacterized protein YecT (DUF1311 family)